MLISKLNVNAGSRNWGVKSWIPGALLCNTKLANRYGQRGQRGQHGFTLIELLVTIGLAGVLLAVAGPSFSGLLVQNRMLTQINGFVNDVGYAKSQAMSEGLPVSMCPSSNGLSCTGASAWNPGWIVFSDPTASGNVPSGVTPIRVRAGFLGADSFTSSPAVISITFSRDGFAMNLPAGGVTLTGHSSPFVSKNTRCVALSQAGRKVIQQAGTGNCS